MMQNRSILITGSNGQLGCELKELLHYHPQFQGLYTDVDLLDITSSDSIENYLKNNTVDILINCAAYTAVDRAEDDLNASQQINAISPKLLGQACTKHGIALIHISTDYVFPGTNCLPYTEVDPTGPTTQYGKTKLAGEQSLLKVCPNAIIIRTAWLYSSYGNNFVKTMLRLSTEREYLKVVCDQIGTPTYAADLAAAIIAIIEFPQWQPGIYHFTNEGVASWYDFSKAIFDIAKVKDCRVVPCSTDQYPTRAKRPQYSVLDKAHIKETFGIQIPYWRDSLEICIHKLMNSNTTTT